MNPAEVLRAAADRIDQLAASLADHVWQAEVDEADEDEWVIASGGPTVQTEHGPVTLGGQWYVAGDMTENVARWCAALGPQVAPHLSSWLRATADDAALVEAQNERNDAREARGYGGQTYLLHRPEVAPAVAFARAVLGETGEQP